MTSTLFRPAVKEQAKLRLAIAGPSGSGKTFTSLRVAQALANGGRVAVVDTEHGSASKYADLFDFDVLEMDAPFHPDRFGEAIKAAGQAGYDVIIVDSLSHAWNGPGGLLEIVDLASRKYKGNSYAAWGEGTPIHNRLIEAIVSAPMHLIGTMRSKQDYILVERNGKQVPQKVGMAPIQRDGMEYEFDVFMEMDIENNGLVTKTRCTALTGAILSKPGENLAETLREWLKGETPRERPATPANTNDAPAGNGKPPKAEPEPSPYDAGRDMARISGANFIPGVAMATGWDEDTVRDIAKALGFSAIDKKPAGRVKQYNTMLEYYELQQDGIEGSLALGVINGVITRAEAEAQLAVDAADEEE